MQALAQHECYPREMVESYRTIPLRHEEAAGRKMLKGGKERSATRSLRRTLIGKWGGAKCPRRRVGSLGMALRWTEWRGSRGASLARDVALISMGIAGGAPR